MTCAIGHPLFSSDDRRLAPRHLPCHRRFHRHGRCHGHRALRLYAHPALHGGGHRPHQAAGRADRLGEFPGLSAGGAGGGEPVSSRRQAWLVHRGAGGKRALHGRHGTRRESAGLPPAPPGGRGRQRLRPGLLLGPGAGAAARHRPAGADGAAFRRRRGGHRALGPDDRGAGRPGPRLARAMAGERRRSASCRPTRRGRQHHPPQSPASTTIA
jgi:hypothetical protein